MVWTTLLSLSLSATAAPSTHRPLDGDQLRQRDALLERVDLHFHPERLDAETVAAHQVLSADHWTCLTPLVAEVFDNWDLFDDRQQAELRDVLGPVPSQVDSALGLPVGQSDDAPTASLLPEDEPCFGHQAANYIVSEHFSVEWDEGTVTEETAQNFSDWLEYSYDVEVDELGWAAPTYISTYPMMAYIYPSNQGGAYTTVTQCGNTYVPYVVAYSGSFNSTSWAKTMAAHEFNHASQFAYGYAHEFWWWEATATYAEEDVYPSNNDWVEMVYVYTQVPYIGMNASAGNSNDQWLFYHTYAMGLWGFFLDNHHGGVDTVLGTWQRAKLQGTSYGYDYWMPDVIDDMGLEFDELYAEFLARNTVMDYEEWGSFYDVELEDSFDSLPAEGGDSRSTRPQSLGANYFQIDADACEDGDTVEVVFSGDDSVDWYVVVANASGHELVDFVALEVEAGEGSGTLDCMSGEDLHVVVSPRDEGAQGYNYDWSDADDFEYSFTADLFEAQTTGDDGGGEDSGAGADDGVTDDGESTGGCGCATAQLGGGGFAGVLLLGLAALGRRRS